MCARRLKRVPRTNSGCTPREEFGVFVGGCGGGGVFFFLVFGPETKRLIRNACTHVRGDRDSARAIPASPVGRGHGILPEPR